MKRVIFYIGKPEVIRTSICWKMCKLVFFLWENMLDFFRGLSTSLRSRLTTCLFKQAYFAVWSVTHSNVEIMEGILAPKTASFTNILIYKPRILLYVLGIWSKDIFIFLKPEVIFNSHYFILGNNISDFEGGIFIHIVSGSCLRQWSTALCNPWSVHLMAAT